MFKPWPDATPEQIEKARKHFEEEHKDTPPANNVRVSYLELNGPYKQVTTPSPVAYKRIFICGHRPGHHLATCPQQIVASLAARAFRRPVTVAERQPYLKLYADVRKRGGSFEEGIALALQGVLVSPDFLFRLERMPPTPDPRGRLRLRAGDAALLLPVEQHAGRRAAAPAPRRTSCARRRSSRRRSGGCCAIRKPQSLVEKFGGQWLQTRALESVRPDADKFPDFDDYLRLSMRKETELFFSTIIREDRSILDFLDAKYTFLNERLARHYGIAGRRRGRSSAAWICTGTPRRAC